MLQVKCNQLSNENQLKVTANFTYTSECFTRTATQDYYVPIDYGLNYNNLYPSVNATGQTCSNRDFTFNINNGPTSYFKTWSFITDAGQQLTSDEITFVRSTIRNNSYTIRFKDAVFDKTENKSAATIYASYSFYFNGINTRYSNPIALTIVNRNYSPTVTISEPVTACFGSVILNTDYVANPSLISYNLRIKAPYSSTSQLGRTLIHRYEKNFVTGDVTSFKQAGTVQHDYQVTATTSNPSSQITYQFDDRMEGMPIEYRIRVTDACGARDVTSFSSDPNSKNQFTLTNNRFRPQIQSNRADNSFCSAEEVRVSIAPYTSSDGKYTWSIYGSDNRFITRTVSNSNTFTFSFNDFPINRERTGITVYCDYLGGLCPIRAKNLYVTLAPTSTSPQIENTGFRVTNPGNTVPCYNTGTSTLTPGAPTLGVGQYIWEVDRTATNNGAPKAYLSIEGSNYQYYSSTLPKSATLYYNGDEDVRVCLTTLDAGSPAGTYTCNQNRICKNLKSAVPPFVALSQALTTSQIYTGSVIPFSVRAQPDYRVGLAVTSGVTTGGAVPSTLWNNTTNTAIASPIMVPASPTYDPYFFYVKAGNAQSQSFTIHSFAEPCGQANSTTYTASLVNNQATGLTGYDFQLYGQTYTTKQFIRVPADFNNPNISLLNFGTAEMMLECWVQPRTNPLNDYVIFSNFDFNTRAGFMAGIDMNGKLFFETSFARVTASHTENLLDNRCHYIVYRRSGDEIIFYLVYDIASGIREYRYPLPQAGISLNGSATTPRLLIGNAFGSETDRFGNPLPNLNYNGIIREVKIWSLAAPETGFSSLTPSSYTSRIEANNGGSDPSLICYLRLNDGVGNILFDYNQQILSNKPTKINPLQGVVLLTSNLFSNLNSWTNIMCPEAIYRKGIVDDSTVAVSETLQLYPNPANHQVEVIVSEVFKHGNLRLQSLQGVTLYQAILNNTKIMLDVSQIANGLYLITVDNGKSQQVQKILINK